MLQFNEDFADTEYAWGDVLITSPLHQTLFNLIHAGLTSVDKRHVHLKRAFHLSFRTYGAARTQPREAT